MKRVFMKRIFAVIFVLVCTIHVSSCSPISSKISKKDLALDPVKQEVHNEMSNFLEMFETLNADNWSEFYSDNALIDVASGRYTPESLEKRHIKKFRNFKRWGVHFSFQIQSLDVVGSEVFIKCRHRCFKNSGTITYLRWYVWKRLDEGWKIVAHTAYPPEYISKEDRALYKILILSTNR